MPHAIAADGTVVMLRLARPIIVPVRQVLMGPMFDDAPSIMKGDYST